MQNLIRILGIIFIFFVSSLAGIINVPADQPSIQAGINVAVNGDTVLVADSTYFENINFKGKAITIASFYYIDGDTSHISNTIIDGSSPANPDSGSVVTFDSGEDTTSVLYGFTITGGSGTITEYDFLGMIYFVRAGGGIFCFESGPRISHNKIISNNIPTYTQSGGGGIGQFNDNNAYIIIEFNQIKNNTIDGIDQSYGSAINLSCNGRIMNNDIAYNISTANNYAWGALDCWADSLRHVLIQNNNITHNITTSDRTYGGGINLESSIKAAVLNNEISFNELNGSNHGNGSGMHVWNLTQETTINGNRIADNSINASNELGGGISLWSSDSINILNNIISGNSARDGGGIYCRSNSNTSIINNTIVNNEALNGYGGGIFSQLSSPMVINSIVWGNQANNNPGVYLYSGSISVTHSNVQGSHPGTGNINVDPLFSDTDTLFFDLSASSPCIGAGTDSIEIIPFDYDGDPRPNPPGCMPDIGAQESVECTPDGIFEIDSEIPIIYALKQNYPNPFNPRTNIQFSIPKSEFVTLKVYNILGQEVVMLVSDKLKVGSYNYSWDASGIASGIYYYKIQAGEFVETRKMIVLR
jgi:parallel beta-helix repeat protein